MFEKLKNMLFKQENPKNSLPLHAPIPDQAYEPDPMFKGHGALGVVAASAGVGASTAAMAAPTLVATLGPVGGVGAAGLVTAGGVGGAGYGELKYLADYDQEVYDFQKRQSGSFKPSQDYKNIKFAEGRIRGHLGEAGLKNMGFSLNEKGQVDLGNPKNIPLMQHAVENQIKGLDAAIGDRHTNKDVRQDHQMTRKILMSSLAELPHYSNEVQAFQAAAHAHAPQPETKYQHIKFVESYARGHFGEAGLKNMGFSLSEKGQVDFTNPKNIDPMQKYIVKKIEALDAEIANSHTSKDKREDAKLTKKNFQGALGELPYYATHRKLEASGVANVAHSEKHTLQASGVNVASANASNVTGQVISPKKHGV